MLIECSHYLLMGLAGYFSLYKNVASTITSRPSLPSDPKDIAMQIGRISMIVHIFIGHHYIKTINKLKTYYLLYK